MSNDPKTPHNSIFDIISKVFFFTLYVFIRSLVLIGEITQKILLSPFILFIFLLRFSENAIASIAAFLLKLTLKDKKTHITSPEKVAEDSPQTTFTPLSTDHVEKVKMVSAMQEVQNQKETSEIHQTQPNSLLIAVAAFFVRHKVFFSHLRPSELLIGLWSLIKKAFSFPQYIFTVLFQYILKLLSKIKPFKQVIQNITVSLRKFNRSWFAIFRISFGSSFRYFILGFIFCLTVIIVQQAYNFVTKLPNPESIGKVNFAQSTHLFDRNGKLLYEIFRDENRTAIKLKTLPKYVPQASIAIEDKNFYNHHGISIIGGMLRAAKDTYRTKTLQGGSTLTQQLVKTALLTPERTIDRKLKEIFLALWAEQIYTKEEILEMYLNQVPYGGSSYGIEEAAKNYFGKHARELNISEAAYLAGLPQAPSTYSPYTNPELAIKRRNSVLAKMKEERYINEKQYKEALHYKLNILPPKTSIRAPHFVFYTKKELEKEYGIKQVEEGGFSVTTTLDLQIQEEAEKILKEELEKVRYLNVTNGGIIVLNPQTGEILAMVGSVDYFAKPSGAFNVTTSENRQPGSTLKPLLYAQTMEKGYTAATTIDDSPVTYNIAGSEPYKPVNYDGKFHGRVPIRIALANSYNIPAVKAVEYVGVDSFVNYMKRMGVNNWNDSSRFGLSIALGGGEVSLLDLAQVYGVLANGGYNVETTGILKMANSKGEVLNQLDPQKNKVMNEGIAFIISDVLSDNVARQQAFGPNSALVVPGYKVAVKTGTTNDKKDNLTVGYTPEFLVAVWVGNNDNTPMNPYLASGITGAAPIWQRTMLYLLQNKVKDPSKLNFIQPENVVSKPCYGGKPEFFLKGTENTACYVPVFKPNDQQKKPN